MSVNIFRSHSKHSFAQSGKTMARKGTIGAFLLTTVYALITSIFTNNIGFVLLAFSLPLICVIFFGLTYSKVKNELVYKLLNYFLIFSSWVALFIAYKINFKTEYVVVMMAVFILIFQVIPTPKKLIFYGAFVFPGFLFFVFLSDVSLQFSSIILFLFLFSFVLSYILTLQRRDLLRNLNSNSSILKALINNTNDAFIMVDHLSKEIKDVNQKTLKLFKVPLNESVFEDKLDGLFHDKDYISKNRNKLREKISLNGYYEDEVLFKTHDGGQFWGHLFLSPLTTAKNNYYLLQIKDIDVKKKFDQKITDNYETYRFILDELEEFIYLMRYTGDKKGTFEYLNPSIEKIYGIKKHEFVTTEIQKKVASRYHPEDIDKMVAKKKVMLDTKEKTIFNYRMKPFGQEEYIWIEEIVIPKLDDDDNIEALLGILKEVTPEK
jgi:PAS domain S-box-containing protein